MHKALVIAPALLFETDALVSAFSKEGYKVVPFDDEADVYVVNTCTVTNQSDHKSRQVINQVHRLHADALKIVTGCMATNYKEALEDNDKIDFVVDNDHKSSITELVNAYFNGELKAPDTLKKDLFGYKPADITLHTRSLIKIQEGCNNFCTFCIIPKVRGRATSRPVEDVLENIRQVIGFGYKEVVLTGVNIGRYHYEDTDFELLVEKILEIPGDFRVRISSIEPDGYTESFFRLFENPKLAPHMHICLQSGSEDILLRMRRMYTAASFEEMVKSIRKRYPDFNITTDVIVGFPGESERDLQDTLDVSKRIGFGHIHTFKYSVRKGTRAERMDNHVIEKEKTRRSERVRDLSDKMKLEYRRSFIGKHQRVLIEQYNEHNFAKGYGEHYVPVVIQQPGLMKNEFYDVLITDVIEEDEPVLVGKILHLDE